MWGRSTIKTHLPRMKYTPQRLWGLGKRAESYQQSNHAITYMGNTSIAEQSNCSAIHFKHSRHINILLSSIPIRAVLLSEYCAPIRSTGTVLLLEYCAPIRSTGTVLLLEYCAPIRSTGTVLLFNYSTPIRVLCSY